MNSQPKILIVDDLEQNLLALGRTLSDVDAEIVKARSGNEALAASLNHNFALAILDVRMPGMDGYELAGLLRSDEKARLLPIIFLTASHPEEEHVFRGYEAGGVDYIVKPYSPVVLVSKVKVFLELHQHRAGLEDLVRERAAELQANHDRLRHLHDDLVRSEARFRSIFDSATDGMLVVDPETKRFQITNASMCRMLGYSREEILALGVADIHPAESLPHVVEQFERQARGEISLAPDTPMKRKDGTVFFANISAAPVPIGDKTMLLGSFRDITERKRLEDQFRQAQKMEAVGQLAGGVAHDFNNQLFVIRGYVDRLLRQHSEGQGHREELEEIKSAAERATGITRQLLAFSRKQVFQLEVLNLNAEIPELEKMLGRLIGEDIALVFVPGASLGSVKVDQGQLHQVIMNLAVNSRDAMPMGGNLTIETANTELDEAYARSHEEVVPGPYVRLAITDSGEGMDAETLSHIFEPFFTTKGIGKGTGLGLATVHGIVKQSGGHISVYSEPGHGTTFKIYLPRVDEVPADRKVAAPVEELPRGWETVLLVEDEAAVRQLLRGALEECGYRVIEAANGAVGLEVARRWDGLIDLLITDVVMPEMSGPALAESLSRTHPAMGVIYMSGYTENAIIQHGVLKPGIVFLQKPCAIDAFLQKVRAVLDAGPKQILVVEDSETTRTLQEVLLKEAGYGVGVAPDGQTAWEQLQREHVDLVITDVDLPVMDGFALTEAIRNSKRLRNVRVMILSGSCSGEGQTRSESAGADAYLEKGTLDAEGLLVAVRKLLSSPTGARSG